MFLNGKRWVPAGLTKSAPQKPTINQSVSELMKPLGEKTWKGNVWGSVIVNVQKDGEPTPSPTPTATPTPPFNPGNLSGLTYYNKYSDVSTLTLDTSGAYTSIVSVEDFDDNTTKFSAPTGSKTYQPKIYIDGSITGMTQAEAGTYGGLTATTLNMTQEYTMVVMLKTLTTGAGQTFFSVSDNGSALPYEGPGGGLSERHHQFKTQNSTSLYSIGFDQNGNPTVVNNSTFPSTTQYSLMVMRTSYSGGVITTDYFLDGSTPIGSDSISGVAASRSPKNITLNIWAYGNGNTFNIVEQMMYDRALTNSEISQLLSYTNSTYNGPVPTPTPTPSSTPTPTPTASPVVLPYLLDNYGGASGAYSVRRLSSSYSGSAIQVRRQSDGALLDIGFVGEDLDTSTLISFIGGGTGRVSQWYDQSGNGNHADGSWDYGRNPLIIDNGVLLTQNGKPAIKFDGIGQMLATTGYTLGIQNIKSFYTITTPTSETTGNARTIFATGYGSDGSVYVGLKGGQTQFQYWIEGFNNQTAANNITYGNTINTTGFFEKATTNGIKRYIDGVLDVEYTLDYPNQSPVWKFTIGGSDQDFNYWWCGLQQEIILYPVVNSGDRTAIESNQTTYF